MEMILVVPREELQGTMPKRGFLSLPPLEVLRKAQRAGYYKQRDQVENDPSLKQLIPYVVFRYKDQFFCYRRLEKGGERRLHQRFSLGIGGHVRHYHEDVFVNWYMNVSREIHEELWIDTPYTLKPRGILNEDVEEVCTVHLGLVYEAWVEDPQKVSVREKEELEGSWQERESVQELVDAMETWSQILWEEAL